MKPRTIHAYLFLALAFVLGASSGGGIVYGLLQRHQAALLEDGGGELLKARRMHALARKLDLDDEQRSKIAAIYRAQDLEGELGDELVSRCRERMREQKAKVHADVRELLRPDQRERYDELLKKRRKRRGKHPGG